MKKQWNVVFCLFVLLSYESLAQNQVFGFKAGGNVSKISVNHRLEDEYKFAPVLGYNFAAFVKTDLQHKFELQNEVSYSLKGLAYKNTDHWVEYFHYITLPVLLNYSLTKKVSAAAGLEPSYMLNYEQCKMFVDRKWDLCVDADLNIKLSPAFGFGLRYNLGLIPISSFIMTDSQGKHLGKVKFNNHTLQFSFIYQFH